MAKSNCFVSQLDLALAPKLRDGLVERGFDMSQPAHTLFAGRKKGVACTLYSSGKLVVQGKDMDEFIEFYLEPEILQTVGYGYEDLSVDSTGRIGIDESGKGDFFGPLCVAGVYASGDAVAELKQLGVRDSKALKDDAILKIAAKIRAKYDHHIIRLNPFKYNELYGKFKNLNRLLAWGHSAAIETLVEKTGCRKAVIDQFAAEWVVENALKRKQLDIDLTQRHRAEEDLVVAAASILARAAFVEGLQRLSEQFDVTLPKGASRQVIEAGRRFVAKCGQEQLPQVGKMHFKTVGEITS